MDVHHSHSHLVLAVCNRGFFPVAVGFIRRIPVLGSLLSLPGIRSVSTTMIPRHLLSSLGSTHIDWFTAILAWTCVEFIPVHLYLGVSPDALIRRFCLQLSFVKWESLAEMLSVSADRGFFSHSVCVVLTTATCDVHLPVYLWGLCELRPKHTWAELRLFRLRRGP